MSTLEYNPTKAAEAQKKNCAKNGRPYFAPEDGICYRCGRNIYEKSATGSGISVEEAGSRYITGCPHCRTTFCD